MRNYEGIFILNPQLTEDEQKKRTQTIQETIKKLDGQVDSVEPWGKRKLAYRINRNNEGAYYLMRFQISPESITKLYKAYKLDDSILRVMIVNSGG
ncbi:MAG: 30S ribosomal protein S6 [Candidatus Omnitrophota bacterium]